MDGEQQTIEQAANPAPSTPTTSNDSSNEGGKKNMWIWVVLAVIVILAIAFVFWPKMGGNGPSGTPTASPSASPNDSPTGQGTGSADIDSLDVGSNPDLNSEDLDTLQVSQEAMTP